MENIHHKIPVADLISCRTNNADIALPDGDCGGEKLFSERIARFHHRFASDGSWNDKAGALDQASRVS